MSKSEGKEEVKEEKDLLRVSINMNLEYRWSGGSYYTKFYRAWKEERKILGAKCSSCGRVYLPPRLICGECYKRIDGWSEISDKGTVRAYTVVYQPFVDPRTGKPRPVPYGMALIQLDGADTTINYFLEENDLSKMRIGMRVQAVWREELEGNITDIIYFRTIEE
ncbi:MAG: Zn-ribbon domain-containing OB-fold protein [Candidatus Jordarchaeaceae archaeon]